ncbi:MAG: DUF1707 domain-containing protein [Streptosporangiaceae bacterium]
MPTQPGPSWQRNFEALFHGSYPDQHLRVSDAERQAVTDRLAEHFSEGRLDQAEFDERVGQAMGAKTRADLSGLFADLPETAKPAPSTLPDVHRRRGHPVLLIALLVVLAIAAAHVVLPLLWIGFVVLAVLFITRNARHTHSHHHSRANQEQ